MKIFLALLFCFFIFLSPLFTHPFYQSHDGEAHVARFAQYYKAFRDGQFPPRWAGNLNYGYGTPIFIFYYPLPGYIASFIHLLGINFQDIFKLLMIISFVAAPIGFYFWAKILFRKEVALLGALLYGLAPYHFLDLYVRGDIAEMIAFVFVPLVFWTIEKVLKTKKSLFIVLGGIFYALLILSHNGVSLMFSPVFLLYALIKNHDKRMVLRVVALLGFGLLLSAFFWVPALYEGKYVNAKLFIGSMYKDNFPSVLQLIVPAWGFGAEVRKPGGLSPQIGLLYIAFVIASFVIWFKTKKQKKIMGFWLGIFLVALFIITPFSTILWRHISLLQLYEFPWRFVGLASFVAAVLACFVLEKVTDKKLFVVYFFVLVLTSLPLIKVERVVSKTDSYYALFKGTTYFHGEASPIWTAGDPSTIAKKQIEIIQGQGNVSSINKKTDLHEMQVNAINNLTLVDNTVYFPGWQANVDGKRVPIQFQDPNHRGLITFQIPQGKHHVHVRFAQSPIRKLADIVTLGALLIMVVFFACALLYNRKVKHL